MALPAGTRLGPYEILEPLGAGGMGEVYRAHDAKLDRDVALKVLPEGALADEEARKRFRREANALSRLSHPHIATLFDFDTEGGIDFLVMELVSGPSLRDTLDGDLLPEKKVVALGTQLARGLQAAHEKGIVHRDLKPANLQLTSDGLLKILDFGLARLAPEQSPPGAAAATQTAIGKVAGTLPYMSPEQLRGRGVDERTDLYAAGAVLYEMATGKRLFTKPSTAELTEAILNESPRPPREVNERISPGLEAVILKALDKDPELRHQTAKDLLVDLERLQMRSDPRPSESESVGPARREGTPTRRRKRWAVATGILVLALAVGTWSLRPPPPPRVTEIRPLPIDIGPEFSGPYFPMWATDGVRVYYTARKEDGSYGLYQFALGGGEPTEISTPFRLLEVHGYLGRLSALVVLGQLRDEGTRVEGAGPVWILPLPGGSPRRLAGLRANWLAVSPDEEQLALLNGRELLLARTDGSDLRKLVELPERSVAARIRWSPDGSRLRFVGVGVGAPGHEVEPWIWEVSLEGGEPHPLWPGRGGDWTGDGRHFLLEAWNASAHRADIYAVREGAWLPWTEPTPTQVTFGPTSFSRVGSRPGGPGLLAFGSDRLGSGEAHRFDRQTGRFEPILGGEPLDMVVPSPDGEWLAWVTFPEGTLWRGRPDGSERVPLTNPPERVYLPSWSPDGKSVSFVGESLRSGGRSLRVASVDGGAVETLKEASGSSYWDSCWLPDGQTVIFSEKAPRVGIHQVDLRTKKVTMFEGAEELVYPKCGRQGQVLATKGRSKVVYWPERGGWEEIGPVALGFETWTRDGDAFCGLPPDVSRIECYSVATGRLEILAELGDTSLFVGSAGWPWMGLDINDDPLVIFARSTWGFYALDWEAP